MYNRVLVVAAHPDDEMLGCGGTLARLKAAGAAVTVLLLGEGPTSRHDGQTDDARRTGAHDSALAAADMLGIGDVRFANLPDNRFDSLPLLEVVQTIEPVARELRPELVLTHFGHDLNIDHQITHQAVMTSMRPLPGTDSFTVVSFEVPSSTEYAPAESWSRFTPTLYVDIGDFLESKQRALRAYSSEMRPWPHPRSHEAVEHLARLRGSQCGREAAEAFVLCRVVL